MLQDPWWGEECGGKYRTLSGALRWEVIGVNSPRETDLGFPQPLGQTPISFLMADTAVQKLLRVWSSSAAVPLGWLPFHVWVFIC